MLSPFLLGAQGIRYAIANEKFGAAIIKPAFWNASAWPIGTSASRDERYSPGSNPRNTDVIVLDREFEQPQTAARIFEATHYSDGETANV